MKTKPCGAAERAGRLAKAQGFLQAAELVEDLADDGELVDAAVTLYVHAGIAAADAICCARLGQHAQGQDHHDAVALIAKVDRGHSKALATLLNMKTSAGYSPTTTSGTKAKAADRAAHHLVQAALAI